MVVAPLLLLAAGVYAKVLARNRWEGRAPAVGYGDVFRKRAEAVSARLKGRARGVGAVRGPDAPDAAHGALGQRQEALPDGRLVDELGRVRAVERG